ncbi:hypothetical protein OKHIL_48100 [Mycolicibacterium mageritense]|nr:hypothetical protein MTY414_71120 [Mycolicibacterium mageritense]
MSFGDLIPVLAGCVAKRIAQQVFSEPIGAERCSSGEGASDEVGEVWDAEVDGGCAGGEFIELGQFLVGAGEADLQSFDLAEPAFAARAVMRARC